MNPNQSDVKTVLENFCRQVNNKRVKFIGAAPFLGQIRRIRDTENFIFIVGETLKENNGKPFPIAWEVIPVHRESKYMGPEDILVFSTHSPVFDTVSYTKLVLIAEPDKYKKTEILKTELMGYLDKDRHYVGLIRKLLRAKRLGEVVTYIDEGPAKTPDVPNGSVLRTFKFQENERGEEYKSTVVVGPTLTEEANNFRVRVLESIKAHRS